ncbi:MAG TPA: hypothetical protein VEF05_12290 [Terriglobales bacterium]|nr:hypothetical protein [Terriglobales bacterium]
MPRMIDSVRNSSLPSNMMQFAAKGALLVPPQEMLEILVYLAKHNKVFGQQARLTLAGWDEASSLKAAGDPKTAKEVLDYFIDPDNLRPALLPALLENPSVSEDFLIRLAAAARRDQVEFLLNSPRASQSRAVLELLAASSNLTSAAAASVQEKLSALGIERSAPPEPKTVCAPAEAAAAEIPPEDVPPAPAQDDSADVPEEAIHAFLSQHAAEITAEGHKPFEPVSALHEELPSEATEAAGKAKSAAAAAASAGDSGAATATRRAGQKKWILSADEQRGSALQKIAKLDTKGRILLAMKGDKEERSLLIRDGTKIVALAVLESPKVTDSEVERFAAQKNVLEAVLREISMKRRFIKQYPIVRNLTFNPRTPIDVSLGLLKNLLIQDLRNLSGNKEVSDTVRKLATKMFRQKLDVTKKS